MEGIVGRYLIQKMLKNHMKMMGDSVRQCTRFTVKYLFKISEVQYVGRVLDDVYNSKISWSSML